MTEKRKRGDRREAKRVRNLDSMHQFMPYVLTKRCDSEVYINEKFDVTEALKYIAEKNQTETEHKLTLFHLILAALSKTIIHRPYLNRFISGRRFYERYDVSFSFVVKKKFSDKGEESLMILRTNEDSTLSQISHKVSECVHEVRETGGNDLDAILNFLVKLPRPALRLFASILNLLEYYNCMPKFLSEVDPYYTTVLIANLGSIKCGAPYHHLTEYGTNSVMVTVGEIHKENLLDSEGNSHIRDIVEMGITIDERIGDGFYFAKSIKLLKYLISNPVLLEAPFKEEVNYDD
ncbi:MAG: 2-oxo acid dehydrogenase subunit E2 [Clostridiales bacterium]|nr:2-oxo acid dehydrogenase subunit E2 [Clostridiales bacterium]